MAKCNCNEPKVKIVKRVANDVQIETRENGFVVRVGKPGGFSVGQVVVTGGGDIRWFSAHAQPQEVTKYEGPATGEEYVFADFASLSQWLRQNIRHGKPASTK